MTKHMHHANSPCGRAWRDELLTKGQQALDEFNTMQNALREAADGGDMPALDDAVSDANSSDDEEIEGEFDGDGAGELNPDPEDWVYDENGKVLPVAFEPVDPNDAGMDVNDGDGPAPPVPVAAGNPPKYFPGCATKKEGGMHLFNQLEATDINAHQRVKFPYWPFADSCDWEMGYWLSTLGTSINLTDGLFKTQYVRRRVILSIDFSLTPLSSSLKTDPFHSRRHKPSARRSTFFPDSRAGRLEL